MGPNLKKGCNMSKNKNKYKVTFTYNGDIIHVKHFEKEKDVRAYIGIDENERLLKEHFSKYFSDFHTYEVTLLETT